MFYLVELLDQYLELIDTFDRVLVVMAYILFLQLKKTHSSIYANQSIPYSNFGGKNERSTSKSRR
jgi:hypothetical protein